MGLGVRQWLSEWSVLSMSQCHTEYNFGQHAKSTLFFFFQFRSCHQRHRNDRCRTLPRATSGLFDLSQSNIAQSGKNLNIEKLNPAGYTDGRRGLKCHNAWEGTVQSSKRGTMQSGWGATDMVTKALEELEEIH